MALCPLTKKEVSQPFLIRENVPTNQNKLFPDQIGAKTMPRGRLELYVCPDTGFIWNGAFDLSLVDYGPLYENTQSVSGYFQDHLNDVCRLLIEDHDVRDSHIIDVGCGKGDFLRLLMDIEKSNTGTGYDTSYIGSLEECDGRLRFHRSYYDVTQADVPVDVIVCRHVIEHIHNPIEFLKELRLTLEKHPHVRLFFETPTVEWILKNKVYYDFFYEHCSYFTPESLKAAFEIAGFQVDDVQLVFNGQYQLLSASIGEKVTPTYETSNCVTLAKEFADSDRLFRQDVAEKLKKIAAEHTIAVWGAGAKGVTFCNLFDPDAKLINCVIDINKEKQNQFLPGTGHAIVAPEALLERGIDVVVGMNPNYYAETSVMIHDISKDIDFIYLCPPFPPNYEAHN